VSRAARFAPLVLLVALLAGLVWRLATPVDTSVHSRMQGRPVATFYASVGAVHKPAFGSQDLASGKPHIVNFFASWCVPCIGEAKVLMELKSRGALIDGIAVRDRPEDVDDFLARHGDPYGSITGDPFSELQIKFGSSGVPESFIIDGRGIVRYQHIGPVDASEVPMILSRLEQAK
jgi:cytochrome c biogenesis protein CcmG/thiol:disulfide interchange protein DsbE